eukprot:EG_transcript_42858
MAANPTCGNPGEHGFESRRKAGWPRRGLVWCHIHRGGVGNLVVLHVGGGLVDGVHDDLLGGDARRLALQAEEEDGCVVRTRHWLGHEVWALPTVSIARCTKQAM